MRRPTVFDSNDVLWQPDAAVFQAMDPSVDFSYRFGKGKVKVLSYDLETDAGTYLMFWPPGYDPLGDHVHDGNEELFVLEGALTANGRVWRPGAYFYVRQGEKHGPLTPGEKGCLFLASVDGPFFGEAFLQQLRAVAERRRHRY